ncbi:ABC-2 transporter permease [Albibacterium bauzanense]|uniref:Cu-processing system permease protein n=1 Tax=Albibacterium bauzanense TaxID=653929 RepID=A0A4R1M745_9SPHI|nr:ABC transporter permease subunit [Albibacterium bauzanense]TCK85649.1 Cu-processing system permease protein [Albibacterium bauzanense]
MNKVIKHVVLDILRNKIVVAYTIFLFVFSMGLFLMEDNPEKSLASILTVNLIAIPLISMVFSAIYIYNSAEFIEFLAAQPIKRKTLWISIFSGLSLSLVLAFLLGCGIPILIFSNTATGWTMLLMGTLLSIIFVAIALLACVYTKDKARGIGTSILLWFYFTVVFDGIVLFLLFQLMDYPLENILVGFSILNPIDLARILILLKMDISALMGASSAVFKLIFGGSWGMLIATFIMLLWIAVPLFLSLNKFYRKDL